jgi:hypothetical protein
MAIRAGQALQSISHHRDTGNTKGQQHQELEVRRDRSPPRPQCLSQIGIHEETPWAEA